jgi:hypothetical protein
MDIVHHPVSVKASLACYSLHARALLGYSSTLKMEATCSPNVNSLAVDSVALHPKRQNLSSLHSPTHHVIIYIKKTPWPESTSELYRPSNQSLSAKLVPNVANRGCHVVSMTDPYGCILGFLEWNRYFSIK